MDRRIDTLESSLDGLTVDERLIFGQLIAKVRANLPETEMDKHRICRLCGDCLIPGNAI